MSEVLVGLNRQQKEAVTTTKGPLLIIAGAGTGKTTVITRRIAYLIGQNLAKPSEILALTFTEKAAGEMEERVDVLVPYGYIDTWISTFHAFGERILRENALELGLIPDFKVLTRSAQILFFQQNLFLFDLNFYRPLSNPTKFIEAILNFISRLKDEDITPQQYLRYVEKLKKQKAKGKINNEGKKEIENEIKRQEELAKVYEQYEQLKLQAGYLDFGDLVVRTLRFLRKSQKQLKKYQEKFKYILVDEFQDTNWAQNELVKLLAGKKANLAVVADDDQSIYRFRGASISNVLDFKKTYTTAKIVTLFENYRSNQAILDSAYTLIQNNNPDRLEVRENINKKLISKIGKGKAPKEIFSPNLTEEADLVAAEIKKLIINRKMQYKEAAILVRANNQADSFIRALNIKGIPSKLIASFGLYNSSEIKLLISALNAISNFDNSAALFNLATAEIYKLPMEDAIKLNSFARRKGRNLYLIFQKAESLKETLELSDEGLGKVKRILQDLQILLELSRKENVGKVLFEFLRLSGYLKELESENSSEAEIKIQNIAKFFTKIKEFIDTATDESVSTFVDYLETLKGFGEDPGSATYDPDLNAVNVMTIHAAKGLEFRAVFLVNLVSDRFPTRERPDKIEVPPELIKETLPSGDYHLEEERRLFYVGMTRAKELLYLSWSRDSGGKRVKKISPFVIEALGKSKAVPVATSDLEKIEKFAAPTAVKPIKEEIKILKLTQGSIDDYRTCAYKYRYAHILKVPILRHHPVVYGAALHQAVAAFWQAKLSGKTPKLEAILEVFERYFESEGFLSKEHEERRLLVGKKVLRSFWKREKETKNLPTFIEKEFRFSLGDILINGRFDRVDVKDGKVRIIDYKSSEGKNTQELEKEAKSSVQLKIYALGYCKNYNAVPASLGIYALESGLVGEYKPSSEILEETENLIKEVAGDVRKNLKEDYFPANPIYFGEKIACYYCAYESICPFSKTS